MFDKSKVGMSFPAFRFEVERGKIRELALAIGDENPIYQSREGAQEAGYEDVPLFPTAPTMFSMWGNGQLVSQLVGLGINVMRVLHAEEKYEYQGSIWPGDTLTGVMTVVDGKSRGAMDMLTLEIVYTNQRGEQVLKAREMLIVQA